MDWITVALGGAQQRNKHKYIHLSICPSISPFVCSGRQPLLFLTGMLLTVTSSLTGQREQLGIVGEEDDMSACQVDVESKAYMLSTA